MKESRSAPSSAKTRDAPQFGAAAGEGGLLPPVFLASPDIVALSSLADGTYLEVNEAFLEASGFRYDEVIGKTSSELHLWADADGRQALQSSLMREGQVKNLDVRFRLKDGRVRQFQLSASKIRIGGRDCIISVSRDATEMKELMEVLQKSRFLLERAEEMADIGSWEFDYAEQTVAASQGAYRIYGVALGMFTVKEIEDIPLPEYRKGLNDAREDLIRRGIPYDIEFKIKRKNDGAIRDIRSKARWDPEKRRLFGIIRDVTEEKAIAIKLEELNRELEVKIAQRTQELSEANRELSSALEEIKRGQNDLVIAGKFAVLGQLTAGIAHELNTPLGAIASANSMIKAYFDEWSLEGLRWLAELPPEESELFSRILALDASKAASVATTTYVARRRALLAKLGGHAAASDEEVADLLVQLDLDYLADSLPALFDRPDCLRILREAGAIITARRLNGNAIAATENATKVIDALRQNLSRRGDSAFAEVDIDSDIETVLTLLHNRLKRGVTVTRRYCGARAWGISHELCQVWTNLINNSAQAIGYSGPIEIITEKAGAEVLVRVVDSGPGIRDEDRSRVFEPFYTTKTPGEGLGLGLSICKRIVESHGGSIDFESRPGRTAFTVRLPGLDREATR
jgi:PAS domain S-box-containing protein